MLVQSENHSHFKRIGSVLIEVLDTGAEVPVFSFNHHFIDLPKLNQTTIGYMNRFMEMFPHLVQKIENKIPEQSPGEQFTLF